VDPRYDDAPITFDSFWALPFAAPPVGDLRFSPPIEAAPWTETRNATKEGSPVPWDQVCMQMGGGFGLINTGEDCLHLSVHVPVQDEEEGPLAVMVWLTGGAFIMGGGPWFGPDYWMIHNIILVTVNYRVGPAGFLTLGTEEAPGNAGLWDQLSALKWVQENIEAFGGDSNRVTLAGESAGSFSAFYHLTSLHSRGLFQRVIGQSGVGGLSPGFHQWSPSHALWIGNEAAVLLGCADLDVNMRLACLRDVPAKTLDLVFYEEFSLCQPAIDSAWTNDPFFTTYPEVAFQEGSFDTSVDVLLGSNTQEGLLFTQLFLAYTSLLPSFLDSWQTYGPILAFQRTPLGISSDDIEMADFLLDQYTGSGRNISIDNLGHLTDLFTDAWFAYGIDRYVDFHLEHSQGRLFQYVNAHVNDYAQFNWVRFLSSTNSLPGSVHGDETFLQFSPNFGFPASLEEPDTLMSKLFTSTWANFIKEGDPSSSEANWKEVTLESREYFLMKDGQGVMDRSAEWEHRSDIWRSLFGG